MLRPLLFALTYTATAAAPNYQVYNGLNQVYNVALSKQNTTTVKYLGTLATPDHCAKACISTVERCWSFTWHNVSGTFHHQCFGLTSPRWSPTPDSTQIVSGIVEWPCRNDQDCSLNGRCDTQGHCQCDPSWMGARCQTLNLLPATHGAGYRGVDDGHNTSSWGGAVLKDETDGRYHMFAAEMTEHCGIGAWAQNSRIVHASSAAPGGAYQRDGVVWNVFSHEPEVVRGPNNEYVMYYTANIRSKHGVCNCCKTTSKCDGSTGPNDCPSGSSFLPERRRLDADPSYMSWSMSPNGPWSTPMQIFAGYRGSDTNFAPVILKNGSLVALWREWTNRGSRVYLATALDWKNASTYNQHLERGELFPDLGTAGTEDPFVWIDSNGHFHSVFHHMYGYRSSTQWWLDAVGGHAFSTDGIDWTYTGVAWGDPTTVDQGNVVHFMDGSAFRFTRRERPHLIFHANQSISHLITAAQYGEGKNPGARGDNGDASYTLVQPVRL